MPILGLILAGGLARRMGGGDKTLLRLGGRTLLEHVIERVGPQCPGGLALSANGDPARFAHLFAGPVLPDAVPGHPGPLAGILAGLEHCAARHPDVAYLLSVPGDAPFLPRDLAARLLAAARGEAGAFAASGGREHYATALWPISARAGLCRALVERGERRVGAVLREIGAASVAWPVGACDPFLNVNNAEDLTAAQACLTR